MSNKYIRQPDCTILRLKLSGEGDKHIHPCLKYLHQTDKHILANEVKKGQQHLITSSASQPAAGSKTFCGCSCGHDPQPPIISRRYLARLKRALHSKNKNKERLSLLESSQFCEGRVRKPFVLCHDI